MWRGFGFSTGMLPSKTLRKYIADHPLPPRFVFPHPQGGGPVPAPAPCPIRGLPFFVFSAQPFEQGSLFRALSALEWTTCRALGHGGHSRRGCLTLTLSCQARREERAAARSHQREVDARRAATQTVPDASQFPSLQLEDFEDVATSPQDVSPALTPEVAPAAPDETSQEEPGPISLAAIQEQQARGEGLGAWGGGAGKGMCVRPRVAVGHSTVVFAAWGSGGFRLRGGGRTGGGGSGQGLFWLRRTLPRVETRT